MNFETFRKFTLIFFHKKFWNIIQTFFLTFFYNFSLNKSHIIHGSTQEWLMGTYKSVGWLRPSNTVYSHRVACKLINGCHFDANL